MWILLICYLQSWVLNPGPHILQVSILPLNYSLILFGLRYYLVNNAFNSIQVFPMFSRLSWNDVEVTLGQNYTCSIIIAFECIISGDSGHTYRQC